ncbi:MAG: B12-binding domain-containing protein, partial [Anaerovorax sp.]
MSKILKKIKEAVEDGEMEDVAELTQEALDDEETPQDILNGGLLEGMNTVGELFKAGEMFVPEVLMSAKAVDAGMEILKPLLSSADLKSAGKIVFCTVLGDLHDIGKKLCVMLLEGAGYEVVDIGVD